MSFHGKVAQAMFSKTLNPSTLGRWRGIKKWEIGARNLMKLNIVEKFL
jgi:hypothetical protein